MPQLTYSEAFVLSVDVRLNAWPHAMDSMAGYFYPSNDVDTLISHA